jgi:hypothetical protein
MERMRDIPEVHARVVRRLGSEQVPDHGERLSRTLVDRIDDVAGRKLQAQGEAFSKGDLLLLRL